MSIQSARNLREWQQAVERGIKAAKSGNMTAMQQAKVEAGRLREEIDAYNALTPAAPIELTVQTSIYIDAYKRQRGQAIFDFPDVVFTTNGTPITVDRYEIWGQNQGLNPLQPYRLLNTSAISSIYATDLTPGSNWKFKLRAICSELVKPGLFTAEQSVTITADTTAPPQLSAPTATAVSGGVKVVWDGLAAGGGVLPGDWSHAELAFGTSSSPTTIIDTFPGASFTIVPKSAYNTVHYFRLRGVDTSGNVGPWSPQASAIPVPLVDVDIILSQIDAATTVIKNIGAASLLDGAVLSTKLADNAVTQAKLAAQAVTFAKLDTTVDAKITKGVTDAATADGKAVNAQLALDAAKLAYDSKIAQIIAQGNSLVRNGDFEAGQDGWPSSSFYAVESTKARSGTKSYRLGPNPAGNLYPASEWVPCAAGRTYYMEMYVQRTGEEVKAQGVGFVAQAKTAAGGFSTPIVGKVDSSTISTTTWTKVSTTYTVTTTDTVSVRFSPWFIAGNNVYHVDDFLVVDVTEANAALAAANQAQTDATTAITNAASALTAANGKNVITNSIASASAGLPGKAEGDRWQKWSTLGTGGKLLATWRWTAGVWVAEALDATYLPLVDIGTGTFGTMHGGRIETNSLSVKSLLVGSFDNVIPDPYFTNANLEWQAASGVYSFPATEGYGGLSAMKIAPSAGQQGRYSTRVPVEGGSSYRVMVWVKSDVDIPAGALGVYHNYRVAGSGVLYGVTNILKQTIAPNVGVAGNDPIPANTWTLLTGVANLNANANDVAFGFYKQSTFTTGTVWYSQATAVRMGDGNLYVDGSITGLAVAANTMTAKNIIIGDFQNFALGSDFDDATQVPWALHGNHTISTAQKKSGVSSLRLGGTSGISKSVFIGDLRVKEGEQYYFRFHAYIDAGFNGTVDSKLRVADQSGNYLTQVSFNAIPRSVWTTTPLEVTLTVPAGVTSLNVGLWSDQTTGYAYIDDIQIRRVAEPSLIQSLGVEKLTASAASMGQATIDKLWASVVNSRKITGQMLTLSNNYNLIDDGQFTQPATNTPWTLYSDATIGTDSGRGNTNALKCLKVPARSGNIVAQQFGLPIQAGDKFITSAWIYIGTATTTATQVYMTATYKKIDGTVASSATVLNVPSGTGTGWKYWESVAATAPALTETMDFQLNIDPAYTGNVVFDDINVLQQLDANLIVDGGIFAKHLTVDDTLWAKVIKFKQLGGDEINVNDLTANTSWIGVMRGGILINDAVTTSILKADAITSKHTITGATFQTTTTANRGIKFTSAGLNMWDAGGKNTLNADAGTGYLTVTGRLRTAPDGSPGAVLIPPAESADGKTMALWLAPDTAVLPGGLTAGVWMSNPVGGIGTAGEINVRGQSYGGVNLFDEVELMSSDGQIPRIASRHGNGLQMTSYDGNLYFGATTGELRTSSLLNTFINIGSGKQLTLQSGGGAYNRTNGSAANAIIFTDGNVFKVSSASKYKIDPRPMDLDPRILDDVTVKSWIDVGMAERYAESYDHQWPYNEQEQREFDALSLERIPGTIAEDVEAAGGESFVVRDLDGEIDSLMYDRLALARTELLKLRVAEQAEEIAELRAMVQELVASLAT